MKTNLSLKDELLSAIRRIVAKFWAQEVGQSMRLQSVGYHANLSTKIGIRSRIASRMLLSTLLMLTVCIGNAWGETKSKEWDLTSSSGDFTSSNCTTYFTQPYGMKKANAYIQAQSISDFTTYASSATKIEISVKCLQNGGTTSRLTVYLLDKDGSTLGSQVITPVNASSASSTTYQKATFSSSLSTATGFMVKCTTFGKNILINGAKYTITYTPAVSCTTNPTVGAGSNSSVTSTTATVSCSSGITSLGSAGCSITSYGFVIGTSSNPTIGGSGVTKHQVGTTYTVTGTSFSKDLTGLSAETTYYVRPYATNGNGTAYGTQTSFTTSALPKYTVTLKDDNSTLTQASAGASVTLPTRTGCTGYTFAGWTKTWVAPQSSWTTTAPTIISAGSYTPTANENLYPVYTKTVSGGAPANTEIFATSSLGSTNTVTSGYAVSAEASAQTGYYQDGSGTTRSVSVRKSNTATAMISSTPTAATVTANLGGGTTKDPLTNSVYAVWLDASGNELGDPVVITTKITTTTGSDFTASLPVSNATSAYGVRIKHDKETGYNVRYYAISLTITTGGSTTYYISVPDCCDDPAVVSLVPDASTIYRDLDGNATTTIGFSQTGGGSGTWGDPTVSPSGPTVTKSGSDINFTATATGTYTVGIGYTETCEKTGSTDITVAEQGIISASGTATFSPSCGENSASNTFTVNSRYLEGSTITASISTTTGSGHFTISTDNSTFNTSNKSISGGTTTKVEDYIYVRYEPTADETGSVAGRLTLTQESTTTYVDLSGTVTCGCNIRFTSDPNLVQITAANGIWVQANTELALSGSFLKTNANNANVSIRAYTDNAHFQLKTSGTTGEGAAKTSSANALSLVTNEGSNTANGWTGSLGVVYKPVAHNTTETATLTVEVYRYEGSTVYASTTYTLYGRSLPDNFVIAVNDGTKDDGHWYAIPADMIAPWGSNCTGLGTYKPYPITVNNNTNPTAVSGDAPARAIYTAAARTGNVNTNPQTMSYKSVALASSGNYYLYGSSSSETTIQNASNAESERQKWFLDVIDWANKKYNMRTDGNSNLLSYYISNVGVYSASGKKPDIYLLPVTTTCNNHLAPEGITCQGIDATNYTIRFTPDRTKNYEVSLNGSSWSDVTTSVVTRCNENDAYPKLVEAQIPLATYRGQTVYIRAKDDSGCPTSTTFAVPNPNVSVNSGTWMSMSGIAGSAFENTANSVTISGLASCGSQTVGVTCSNDKISASVNQSTGVVTISMTAGNATAGEHTGTLTFTLTGGATRTQNISITLSTRAVQEWDDGDLTHFWEGMLCDEEGLAGDPIVYLSNALYYNGSTVSDYSTFNSNSTIYLKDLNTNSNVTAHTMTRLNAGSGVFGVNLSYLTSYGDLTVGHRYRLAWENHSEDNSIQNAITNSSGLPYADCYMEFVYSQNCSAPTLGIECITNTTAQVSWGNTSASCSNYTLEWFQRTESSLTDYSIKDNTSNLQIWKYGNTVYESGNSYLNKWVVNDNNNSYKSANYGYQVGGSTVQNYIYTPRLNQLYASAGSGTMYEVTVTLYNGNTNSNAYAAKCFAVDNTSNGDYITTGYSATYNGASATNYVTPACPASSTQAYTFRVTGLTATSRIGFTCNTKGNKLYVKNVAVKRLEEGVHSSTTIAKSEDNYTITGLTAGKTYGATLTCGSSTSNEITLNTRSGTPLIYFKDGGSTITSYTFDETAVGESSSKTLNVTASKTGICDLNDLVRSLTGTGAGMFSVSVDFSTWNFYPLVGTYNGDITITYSPTSPGEHTATYTITDNGTSKTLTLNGTATGGQIEVVQWAPKGIIVESYVLDEGTPAVDSYDGVLQANGTYQIADAGWDLASQANEMIDIEWDETTESVRVPVMVTSSCNSSTLSSVTSTSDIVVMANKTLTINSSLTCHGLELYPTAKVVFSSGSLTADYVRLYCNGDTWANFPSFDASGASSISVDNAYVDFRIDESRFHFITLPFDVQTGDVVYAAPAANGANPPALRNSANNTAFYVRQYDGIARETNNKATEETYNTNMPHIGTAGGNYTMTAGRGYMIGIGDQASALGHAKRTLRFPIAMNSTKWTAEKGSSKVIGGSWVADGTDNSAARPVNKGWNLVGNPFMRELAVSSTSDKISTGHMVETDGNPRWTITEEDVRYITIYNAATDAFTYQSIASSFTLKPMAAFYMQMKDAKYINFQASMAGQAAASPIRRTNEQDEEVNVILNLSVGNISDKAGVVLYDYYDAAYNETDNADYPKLMSNSQLALWSIAGTEPLASNGLPKNTAKDIPLGYQAPKEGQYIFTLDINESNMNWLKHVWLTDLAQNVTCDLMLDSYNFSLTNAEKRTDRFLLNVELLSMDEVTTDIDSNIKNTDSCHPIKFIHEDKLYILHDGLIYDMTGKRVNVINK